MSILTLVITLLVIGILMYLVNRYLPLDPTIKKIINITVGVIVVIWILKVLGFWQVLSGVKV